jgi:hypothetical protein
MGTGYTACVFSESVKRVGCSPRIGWIWVDRASHKGVLGGVSEAFQRTRDAS